MKIQRNSLTIRNIIAYYEPFMIKEVFHNKLNRVVHYAVFIDNDPFEMELGFDKILFNKDGFVVNMEMDEIDGELVRKVDVYFLTKLATIIEQKLKSHTSNLLNIQNILQEVISKESTETTEYQNFIDAVKRDISYQTERIEFYKASEEKLKTNYKLYSYIKKLNGITS